MQFRSAQKLPEGKHRPLRFVDVMSAKLFDSSLRLPHAARPRLDAVGRAGWVLTQSGIDLCDLLLPPRLLLRFLMLRLARHILGKALLQANQPFQQRVALLHVG